MPRPTLSEIDEIRQQMAKLRLGLHQDAAVVVGEASQALDWKSILTRWPWVTFGVAMAAGYFLVPRKKRPIPVAVPPREVAAIVSAVEQHRPPVARAGGGLGGAFWSLAKLGFSIGGPIALQAAQSYAIAWLEDTLAKQQSPGRGGPPSPAAPTAARSQPAYPGHR